MVNYATKLAVGWFCFTIVIGAPMGFMIAAAENPLVVGIVTGLITTILLFTAIDILIGARIEEHLDDASNSQTPD